MHTVLEGPESCIPGVIAIFMVFVVLISLAVTALLMWAYCKIVFKAGYHWAFGLLMLVPVANLIMPLILAFSDWPICKEIRLLKQQTSGDELK